MGGAQPLAVTMAEGTCLIADVQRDRLEKRVHDRYLDEIVEDLDAAIDRALELKMARKAISAEEKSSLPPACAIAHQRFGGSRRT